MPMMRAVIGTALIGVVVVSAGARAEPVASAGHGWGASTDVSAQRRGARLRIYPRQDEHWQPDVVPRFNPGPNAVRVCNARYVQEARPSGTVIVPHMSCFWRG